MLKNPVVSVPSSGRPTWLVATVTSGNEARIKRDWSAMRIPSLGPVLGARVPRTHGDWRMLDRPLHTGAIFRFQEFHGGIAPFPDAVLEEKSRENGSDNEGGNQPSEQGKANGPGHRLKQTSFDAFQGENRQISGNDDGSCKEDGPYHFGDRIANSLKGGFLRTGGETKMADHILKDDDRAVDDHAKIQSAKGKEICRDAVQVQTDCREEQRERNGQRDDDGTAKVPKEEKQNHQNQYDPRSQVMENGAGREMQQVAAIKHWDDLHAGRQDALVKLLHLLVDGGERFIGIGSLAQQHDALDYIVVVDNVSVSAVNGLAIFSQANFWPLLNRADIPNTERGTVLGVDHRVCDVIDGTDQTDSAHIHLLQSRFNEAAARIYVVVRKLSLQLTDAESIGDELVGIDAHLVFARHATQA